MPWPRRHVVICPLPSRQALKLYLFPLPFMCALCCVPRACAAIWLLFHYYCYWKSFFPDPVIIIALSVPNAMIWLLVLHACIEHNRYPTVFAHIWHRHKSNAILLLFYFCWLTMPPCIPSPRIVLPDISVPVVNNNNSVNWRWLVQNRKYKLSPWCSTESGPIYRYDSAFNAPANSAGN